MQQTTNRIFRQDWPFQVLHPSAAEEIGTGHQISKIPRRKNGETTIWRARYGPSKPAKGMNYYFAFPTTTIFPEAISTMMAPELKNVIRICDHLQDEGMVMFVQNVNLILPLLARDSHFSIDKFQLILKANPDSALLNHLLKLYEGKEMINNIFTEEILIETICKETGVDRIELMKNLSSRKTEFVFTRQLGMIFAIPVLKYSLAKAGFIFKKDHATVLNARRTIHNLFMTEKRVRELVTFLALKFKMREEDIPNKLFPNLA